MIISTEFQTPPIVCDYMASMVIHEKTGSILEPTPGIGNLVTSLKKVGIVTAPEGDFWELHEKAVKSKWRYNYVVMNPPFTPIAEGFRYLQACMQLSDKIIVLIPWLLLINSQKRMDTLMDFGIRSITNLPRKTFPNSRIQCCIVNLDRSVKSGYMEFKNFNW